jgi:hypothetical protein
MFIEAQRPPTVGEHLLVALEAGPRTIPFGEAEVVWRRSGSNPGEHPPLTSLGFGLKFIALDPGARSLVEAVVKHGGTSSMKVDSDDEEPTHPDRPSGLDRKDTDAK